MVRWDANFSQRRTPSNIVAKHEFRFVSKNLDMDRLFVDAEDVNKKLTDQPLYPDSAVYSHSINALATFFFAGKHYDVYFDNSGNFLFNDTWHQPNWGMYYSLFRYFSNEIVSEKVLQVARSAGGSGKWIP